MKITTTKKNRRGLIVQIDGISVEFNKNLEAEVTAEEAEKIQAKDSSILLEGEEPKVLTEEEKEVLSAKAIKKGIPSPAEAAQMMEDRKAAKVEEAPLEETPLVEAPLVESTEEATEEAPEESEEESDLGVSELTIAELKGICESEGFDKSEWSNLKKQELVDYVESKLK